MGHFKSRPHLRRDFAENGGGVAGRPAGRGLMPQGFEIFLGLRGHLEEVVQFLATGVLVARGAGAVTERDRAGPDGTLGAVAAVPFPRQAAIAGDGGQGHIGRGIFDAPFFEQGLLSFKVIGQGQLVCVALGAIQPAGGYQGGRHLFLHLKSRSQKRKHCEL